MCCGSVIQLLFTLSKKAAVDAERNVESDAAINAGKIVERDAAGRH